MQPPTATNRERPTKKERAQRSRAAILASAQEHFARSGFAGATVRAIAQDADIDPSMVIRYFGDKRGLFTAATTVDVEVPDLSVLPEEQRGRAVVEHFLRIWDDGASSDLLSVLLRSAMTDPVARDRVVEIVEAHMLPMVTAVVSDEDEAPTRTGLIAGQVLGLALSRKVLELPLTTDIPAQVLVNSVGATIQQYLTAPLD
ncbi:MULTISPECIES: TetR/AcrR family transcriptional regulator [Gordonia]|uniref:Putative TetR family transcriptional regulator n=1 Tax=Gordonia sputi NBRC 100414 TaxID=1089453 RepID=H5TW98_9ACTN|nr:MULTISPECIES: TetR family transcriptional regulator [Gordonia]NKY93460.1 TetR/AcrR family transcriptional regulator [Gordonia sputi]OBA40000.1 TetR family transcriptional regulator [Gordonia sp. 852002-51296_SCH5728562-b]OBC03600.1 TetR family transcriptional regulator [Gordonia sp. 852002-50816_SCH5313054-a]OBC09654.1 TetR family transcriptional regulator [Gordonia sp. 852002-50395_SCH5434458]OBC19056.1 TetR family transcriptional regulator [Gordonia sp. 852002-50816_SCH5313054-c]